MIDPDNIYEAKPFPVIAAQWDGTRKDVERIRYLFPEIRDFICAPSMHLHVIIKEADASRPDGYRMRSFVLHPSDWLLYYEISGRYGMYSNIEMEALFKPAGACC